MERIANPLGKSDSKSQSIENKGVTSDAGVEDSRLSLILSADPRFSALLDAWPTMPEMMRLGMLAMVEAVTEKGTK